LCASCSRLRSPSIRAERNCCLGRWGSSSSPPRTKTGHAALLSKAEPGKTISTRSRPGIPRWFSLFAFESKERHLTPGATVHGPGVRPRFGNAVHNPAVHAGFNHSRPLGKLNLHAKLPSEADRTPWQRIRDPRSRQSRSACAHSKADAQAVFGN
jgi:hypothetical protein